MKKKLVKQLVPIKFLSRKAKQAHSLFNKAVKMVGGNIALSKLLGYPQTQISVISCGQAQANEEFRKQRFPTPEIAIKISLATKGEIKAEDLLPHHDFKYMYEYVKMMEKIK